MNQILISMGSDVKCKTNANLRNKNMKLTEPILIKAGSNLLKLGLNETSPKVDCRVIEETNYQVLKRAFDLHIVSNSEVFEHYGKPFTSGRELWDFLTAHYNFTPKI